MTERTQHCQRPWWKRPPVWLLALALVGALGFVVLKETGTPPPMPYGAFLDQLDAGNVVSVTFHGTEIDGRFRHGLNAGQPTGIRQRDDFRSRVPDFGDPALLPELRRQHVVIDVASPSGWTSVLSHLPWPLVAFLVVAAIVAVMRIVRGSKGTTPAIPMHGGGGVIGLVSTLLSRKNDAQDSERDPRSSRTSASPRDN